MPDGNGSSAAGGRWIGTGPTPLESLMHVARKDYQGQVGALHTPWRDGHELQLRGRGGIYSWERNLVSVAPREYSSLVGGKLNLDVSDYYDTLVNHDMIVNIGKMPDPEPLPSASAVGSGSGSAAGEAADEEALTNLEDALLALATMLDAAVAAAATSATGNGASGTGAAGSSAGGGGGSATGSGASAAGGGSAAASGSGSASGDSGGPTDEELEATLADLEAALAALPQTSASGSGGGATAAQRTELEEKLAALRAALARASGQSASGSGTSGSGSQAGSGNGVAVSVDSETGEVSFEGESEVDSALAGLLETVQSQLASTSGGAASDSAAGAGSESGSGSGSAAGSGSGSGIEATAWGRDRLVVDGDMHWTFDERVVAMSGTINRTWIGAILRAVPMEGVICGGSYLRVHAGPQATLAGIASGDVYGGAARMSTSRVYMALFGYRSTDSVYWGMANYTRLTAITIEPAVNTPSAHEVPKNFLLARKLGRLAMALCPFVGIAVGLVTLIPSLIMLAYGFLAGRPPKPPMGPPRTKNTFVGVQQMFAGSWIVN